MKLTEQQELSRRRGKLASDFLSGDFFLQFVLPFIEQDRLGGYPEPNKPGWEEEYRLAFAKDKVYTELFSLMKNWTEEAKQLDEYEQTDRDITST